MTIHLQEVVRSEVEGGLSGPANPIPSQSIDCGCGQLPCPKLAKFATRRLFVGLLSLIGLGQTAAYTYFYIAAPTIGRKFHFDSYIMEWVLMASDLASSVLGVMIAYWGDKIHRVAWMGSIVLLQALSYFILIIPHLTHPTKLIDDPDNSTHMSLYADDNRELCMAAMSRIVVNEEESCYFTLGVIVVMQIATGVANIAYYALGISYLDDNTKKEHVAAFIGGILSVKIIGVLLGYILVWTCLRIDAVTLSPIESYTDQIGAWWLGLPILALLLIVPGLLLSWFPRMLPSEVVELAAASLLTISGRYNRVPRRLVSKKLGSPNFWPSLGRLFINKIFVCNIVACTIYIMALVNFMGYENLIIQSKFYIPKPTGTLLGFSDPMLSRLVSNILKPILIGLIIILSGLVIAKAKPSGRSIVGFGIIVILLSAGIIFSLTAISCQKKPIVGIETKGSIYFPLYCNKDCGCSNDADFRPVCDSKGIFTFYSPCHAGCTSSEIKNGVTTYNECSCVKEVGGLGNTEAHDGPCNSNDCQIGWLIFEFGTLLAYALAASTLVGDFLVVLRSVYIQDKAISIGFWMMWSAIIVNIPGKILYDYIANLTCQYWGTQKSTCRLHNSLQLGNYLYYLTGSLLGLSVLLKVVLYLFCEDLQLYAPPEQEDTSAAEMQKLMQKSDPATKKQSNISDTENDNNTSVQVEVTTERVPQPVLETANESPGEQEEDRKQTESAPLKYGPLGPGDRRTDSKSSLNQPSETQKSEIRGLDSEDELSSSDEDGKKDSSPKVAYSPLGIDSDVESDLSSAGPRSRKRVVSRDYDRIYNTDRSSSAMGSLFRREFPNPDDYEDPRLSRRKKHEDQNGCMDGSSDTSSFEFSRKRYEDETQRKGDFNEVGIPIVEPHASNFTHPDTHSLKDVQSLINQYELNAEQQPDGDQQSVRSGESVKVVSGIPLVAMAPKRPSSKGQYSSGFSSPVDIKVPEDRPESRDSQSPQSSSKGSRGTLHTDF